MVIGDDYNHGNYDDDDDDDDDDDVNDDDDNDDDINVHDDDAQTRDVPVLDLVPDIVICSVVLYPAWDEAITLLLL